MGAVGIRSAAGEGAWHGVLRVRISGALRGAARHRSGAERLGGAKRRLSSGARRTSWEQHNIIPVRVPGASRRTARAISGAQRIRRAQGRLSFGPRGSVDVSSTSSSGAAMTAPSSPRCSGRTPRRGLFQAQRRVGMCSPGPTWVLAMQTLSSIFRVYIVMLGKFIWRHHLVATRTQGQPSLKSRPRSVCYGAHMVLSTCGLLHATVCLVR